MLVFFSWLIMVSFMRYKRHITFLAVLAIISLLMNERAQTSEVVAGQWVELSPAQNVPKESYAIDDGKRQTLSDFKGKPVLLNFWATWCAPCLK